MHKHIRPLPGWVNFRPVKWVNYSAAVTHPGVQGVVDFLRVQILREQRLPFLGFDDLRNLGERHWVTSHFADRED